MNSPANLTRLEEVLRVLGLPEVTEALDAVLFSASLSYLDVAKHGAPSEEDANNVYLVRKLLEALRDLQK